jgi:hypothetical protein
MYTFKYDVDELNAVVKYIKENNPYIWNQSENDILHAIRGCIKNWYLTKPYTVGTLGFQITFEQLDEDNVIYLSFKVDLFYEQTTEDYETYIPGQVTKQYRL